MSAFHPKRTFARVPFWRMIIADEQPGDESAIREIVRDAFAVAPHSSGTEWAVVDALRAANALSISLVAVVEHDIVGHVAVSPVSLGDAKGWYGLGPVSVRPEHQRQGFGAALIREALERLRGAGAAGCVVLGDPDYYARFGFEHDPEITFGKVPPPYFQALRFKGPYLGGRVEYHAAFNATG